MSLTLAQSAPQPGHHRPSFRFTKGGAAAAPAGPPTLLRLSAGFVYFYFGFLKFFPDLSPGELLAGETIMRLTAHTLRYEDALLMLAIMECAIGLCFLFRFQMHWMFFLFVFHQASTFLPLLLVPELCFKFAPFAPTLEGQYIFKNLISLSAGLTVMLPAVQAHWAARLGRPGLQAPLPAPAEQLSETA